MLFTSSSLIYMSLIGAAGALTLEVFGICSLLVRSPRTAHHHLRRFWVWLVIATTLLASGLAAWAINEGTIAPNVLQIFFCGAGAHALIRAAMSPAFPAPAETASTPTS